MKKNILSLAALLIASATFVACSSDDNIISEQPTKAQTYTMTINASKGDGATTRALSIDDSGAKNVLNATWATTENIYVKKGETWASGSLQPDADGATATLKGTLSSITIAKDDVLTLQFPKSDAISYDGQVGTLEDIAANFDYATATVEVESVSASGNINPKAATTTFTNQQAIIKFTLKDKANDAAISPSALTVTDGTSTVELTSIPADTYTANGGDNNVLYVAFPAAGSAKTVTLTATVGDDTYTFEKSGVTFTNGQYYEITVKMTKPVPAATGHALSASAVGEIVCSDGLAYAAADKNNLPTGVTAVAIVAYLGDGDTSDNTYNNGLAIAMSDANDGSGCGWGDYFVSYNCVSKSNDIATAIGYKDGISSTNTLTSDGHYHEAATAAVSNNGTAAPTGTSGWFLPSMGQWNLIVQGLASKKAGSAVTTDITKWDENDTYKASNLNSVITDAGGTGFNSGYQSSTQYDSDDCWHMDISSGRAWNYAFYSSDYVRSVLAF